MEFTLFVILILVVIASVCEFIDSSMGMMYGTILSPVLIIFGLDPLTVIPSIVFSQAVGGLIASVSHHRLKNAKFKLRLGVKSSERLESEKERGYLRIGALIRKGMSNDLRAAFTLVVLGMAATILSVLVAISIPKSVLTIYIGVLVLVMGVIVLSGFKFKYTWKMMFVVALLSAFNKGLSGGGFGPVTTSGQMIAGRDGKGSIGATTLAEAPICFTSFLTYLLIKGLADWHLLFYLSAGSIIGALIGPYFTAGFRDDKKLKIALGMLAVVLGVWMLLGRKG